MVPVLTIQVSCVSTKAAIDNILNKYGSVSIKPYYGHWNNHWQNLKREIDHFIVILGHFNTVLSIMDSV